MITRSDVNDNDESVAEKRMQTHKEIMKRWKKKLKKKNQHNKLVKVISQ